ncbi:hypothetical protein AB1Y20_019588 [Prymnesium parvum]|uniref:Alpha-galactosidase n=1 Tax=Prymnesium parvum TaxID=97485 RepID=A0AB34JRG3_PRYPA
MALMLSLGTLALASPQPPAFPPGWNGLARTPPMGWRSWNAFGSRITQPMMLAAAAAIAARNRSIDGWASPASLCDVGYCSVGVDEGWEACGAGVNGTQHNAQGRPTIDEKAFPDTAAMVAQIHSLGLSAGWYLNGCKCGERSEVLANYQGDIASLRAFGFDGVKIDGCGAQKNQTLYAELMRASGRAFTIENCHWGDCTGGDDSSCPTPSWCPFNWYRTSMDISTSAMSWLTNLQTASRFLDPLAPLSVPGCWAYPDMLEVGQVDSPAPGSWYTWNRAHFGAWCIISAPLILGLELTDARLLPVLDIIGNREAIAINQAWAGHPGMLVANLAAPPQRWAKQGITVPSSSPGDLDTSNGAQIVGAPADASTSGAANIRTGGPGGSAVIRIGSGIVGEGHSLDSIAMSLRYAAGYTPAAGEHKAAATVALQVLEMETGTVLRTAWTSGELGNYSWDRFTGYSPPLQIRASGLGVKLSEKPVILALAVTNHERNLQIPVDDKAAGFNIQVGFDGESPRESVLGAAGEERSGLYPYHGSGVPFGAGQLWAKRQPGGAMAILLINHRGESIVNHTVDLKHTLNLTAGSYEARDVWAHKPMGVVSDKLSLSVVAYDSAFILLTPTSRAPSVDRR